MSSQKNNDTMVALIIAGVVLSLTFTVAALVLALDDSRDSNNAVTMGFLGFIGALVAGLAVGSKKLNETVDTVNRLNDTVQNGGIERPMKRALSSPEGRDIVGDIVKRSVVDVMNDRDVKQAERGNDQNG